MDPGHMSNQPSDIRTQFQRKIKTFLGVKTENILHPILMKIKNGELRLVFWICLCLLDKPLDWKQCIGQSPEIRFITFPFLFYESSTI